MDDQPAPSESPRVRPTETGDERATLSEMLDFLRAAVAIKVDGLSDEQAAARPVPASELTVAGLVKHLTGVERFWFSIDYAALDLPWPWAEDDPHGGFPVEPGETLDGIVAEYVAECERSRAAVGDDPLDSIARSDGMDFNLRFALVHLIEETSRHLGHLDLLRETLDGAVGY